mgnify:FL=1|jgi:hypothetical protein
MHYERWRVHGDPLFVRTAESRFWAKVDKDGPLNPRLRTKCWTWTACTTTSGYGQFGFMRKVVPAHVFSWELENGPIPAGYSIDHHFSCPKNCVNPAHLRTCTPKQQMENRLVQSNSSSGYRGVSWDSGRGMWRADITHHGRGKFLGHFHVAEVAAEVVRAKRNELFTHNDPDRELSH